MKNGAITVQTDGEGIWLDRFIDREKRKNRLY